MNKTTESHNAIMNDVGISIIIFIVALVTISGTLLRIIAKIINIIAFIICLISEIHAKICMLMIMRRNNKSIDYKH